MAFIEVSVDAPYNKTKKALREAVAANPERVYFSSVAMMGPKFAGYATELPQDGTKLTVVGPDPFTKRDWYATVAWVNGSLKVT